MTALYFIRHADYIDDRVDGQGPMLDLGLSARGLAQALALKARLADGDHGLRPDVFISSTMRRAVETAEVIAPAIGMSSVLDADLEEWRNTDGHVDVETFESSWLALPERERMFHRFAEGCETRIEFTTRVHSALHRILRQHVGKSVLIVAHGGVIEASFGFFFGHGEAAFHRAYPAFANTSITHWRHEDNGPHWVLEFSNDSHHLQRLGA